MSCSTIVALLVLARAVSASFPGLKQNPVLTAIKKMQDSVNSGMGRRLAEEDGPSMEAMKACMVVCPKMGAALAVEGEEAQMKEQCSDLDGTIGCVTSQTDCAVFAASAFELNNFGGADSKVIDQHFALNCKKLQLKCDEKGDALSQGTCGTSMAGWTAGEENSCEAAASSGTLAAKKSECCPFLQGIIECYSVECWNLNTAMAKMSSDNSKGEEEKAEMKAEMEKNMAMASTCAISGAPTSASDVDSIVSSGGGTTATVASFAFSATPVAVLAAMVLAVFA